jgi:hypothetical protein
LNVDVGFIAGEERSEEPRQRVHSVLWLIGNKKKRGVYLRFLIFFSPVVIRSKTSFLTMNRGHYHYPLAKAFGWFNLSYSFLL